ncbi:MULTISPECIES: vWA domain-containing protein [Staphylococcus]|uniref:vWA domain-containing protein n=1 Tax=Staphylococcus TaxID=1279 RepID=UPI0002E1FF0E|nr:nitric oxide reductase activation protein NorD [Staphylococcus capitis]MBC3070736.1 nitric oxide reductase activation protein NorD [Staphylococcus capitis]MBC3081757.1 nitric oxide reductase activation protein NorD [Staphylococcus capitis]MBO0370803.1 nitric oxide reductase activation protein NorD [Staphylococcus capitis]MBO0374737.1 nitric oxide reductase activation protein NorD [Staphylococcus capitis]MCI2951516.1 nitric oxide reductase activation protein NorD [Staphylococcus capitis]
MSDRFIKFNDEQLDAKQVMMLQDLARLLLKDEQTQVKIQKFPFYNPFSNTLITSWFWSHRPHHIEQAGLKTDVLLAAYGYQHMDIDIVNHVLHNDDFHHTKFFHQLFKLLEDVRILELIRKERPSTAKYIDLRLDTRLAFTDSQINVYKTKTVFTDLLFLNLERAFLSQNFYDVPSIHPTFDDVLVNMYQYLPNIFQNKTSEDNMYLAERIMYQVDDLLKEDMLNEYYYLPLKLYEDIQATAFEDLKRTDASNTDGNDKHQSEEDVETAEAETKTADSETKGGAYLEMELHEGENSEVIADNDTAREGDSTDDMTDMMTKKGKGSQNTLDHDEGGFIGQNQAFALEGINKNVKVEWKVPNIQPQHILDYQHSKNDVQFEIKDLIQIIKKTINREHQDERHNLTKGRLQKDLINWFIDDQYKLFYKKQDLSKTFDATFTLLVDASASMHDKMDETIKGVVLFHETLKSLNIKHEILAFNEDAFEADDREQPNIIDEIINYNYSIFEKEGPRIMSLEPQDDNRDGVAIRIASERLLQRSHQQCFLIVFSDGEPSAFNYSQDGIIDTYEAVETARKFGIEVFNVFLSQEAITEDIEQTIHNIYGQFSIFVEGVEHLPNLLSPLLKKLLLKSF